MSDDPPAPPRWTRIAVVSSVREGTGNAITAARLASLLAQHCTAGGEAQVVPCGAFPSWAASVADWRGTALVALHAVRAGAPITACATLPPTVPVVVVLGGASLPRGGGGGGGGDGER
jgi:hypothetical protein